MTFLEAAIEILKREGKPLHFKDLTRLAIKSNLLTVIGRDPEMAMQSQLQTETKRPAADLLRVGPGVFGLRSYPEAQAAQPAPARPEQKPTQKGRAKPARQTKMPAKEAEPATPAQQGPAEDDGGKAKGRNRGRRRPVAKAAPPAHEGETPMDEASPPRRRRGGRTHAPTARAEAPEAQAGATSPHTPGDPEGQEPATPEAAVPAQADPQPEQQLSMNDTAEHQPPPAATPPAEERTPAPAVPAGGPPIQAEAAPTQTEANPASQSAQAEPPPRLLPLAEAVVDVLRGSSDGRPVHFRQISDIALKRRLVRGEAADLWRSLRAAVVRDQRQRDVDGLRPRVKNLGQGQYVLADRKLEPELQTAERELLDRLNRTREATRVALRRRLKGLPASAFELLMRLLLERLGMISAELIKRGEGVAYYGGSLARGARNIKLLVAVRSGETELTREAVGELRAGMLMRGYEEGLLLCAARAGNSALAEVNAAPGVELYDQEPLTDLLIRNQLGVRRMSLPIDYLDIELFTELLEPV